MKEYIERELAVQELEVLRQKYEMHDDCDELVARRCRNAVSALPAADVAPVRRGRWKNGGNGLYDICTACGEEIYLAIPMNYCPNCGARMGKEDEHD